MKKDKSVHPCDQLLISLVPLQAGVQAHCNTPRHTIFAILDQGSGLGGQQKTAAEMRSCHSKQSLRSLQVKLPATELVCICLTGMERVKVQRCWTCLRKLMAGHCLSMHAMPSR